MIKCQVCNKITKKGEKCNFLIIEKRPKIYTRRYTRIDRKTRKESIITEEVGTGYETVTELKVCSECKEKKNG